jgi:hypothetical protein
MFLKITGPGDAPEEMLDWQKISELFQATWLRLNAPPVVDGIYIRRGSAVCVGGKWYVATTDETITGTKTDFVKLTVSGDTLVASFAANLSGVAWNTQWSGWYASGSLYLFDEIKALAGGHISRMYTPERWRVEANLAQFLSRDMDANWNYVLTRNLPTQWKTLLMTALLDGQVRKVRGLPEMQTITATSNYTVPAGVYRVHVKLIGPGTSGSNGNPNSPGRGGDSGREVEADLNVYPGQVIACEVTAAHTKFGELTALAGGGHRGHNGTGSYNGGHGGGPGGGSGGGLNKNGSAGTAPGAGGGGGGGTSSTRTTSGGSGALGKIVLT